MKKTSKFIASAVTIFALAASTLPLLAQGAKVGDDTLIVTKPGSSADKRVQLGTSSQGVIKYDVTNSKLRFANDGATFKDMGSGGSGGAGGVELLTDNSDFESGVTTNWTGSSPSTITARTGAGTALYGLVSARFQATASAQTYTSTAYTVQPGLYGGACLGYIRYVTSEATNLYSIQVLDGSNNVLGTSTIPTSLGTVSQNAYVPFTCPSSGTVKLQVVSSGTAAYIDLDNAHLGSDTRLVDVSQARMIGSLAISGCAGAFSRSSATLGDFTATTGCTATQVGNGLTYTSTTLPQWNATGPAGDYEFVLSGGLLEAAVSAGNTAALQMVDSNGKYSEAFCGSEAGAPSGSSAASFSTCTFKFNYTSSINNLTFKLQGKSSVGSINLYGTTLYGMGVTLKYFPSANETGLRVDNIPGIWSAISTQSGTNSSTSNADFGGLSGSISSSIPSGVTCTASASVLGIDCTLNTAGLYKVCASGDASNGATPQNTQIFLADGSNIALSGVKQIDHPYANAKTPYEHCGYYQATGTGSKTFKIYGKVSSNTSTVRVSDWSVTLVSYGSGALPIFRGMVTSTSSTPIRHEFISFSGNSSGTVACTSSPCTVNNSSDGATVTRSSAGTYVISPVKPWSAAPTCTVGFNSAYISTVGQCVYKWAISSPSALQILCQNTAQTTPTDSNVDVICSGR